MYMWQHCPKIQDHFLSYLRHGVDQGFEVRAGVRGPEELHPEVEGVHELPVVHRLDRLLLLQRHRVPQAKGPYLYDV